MSKYALFGFIIAWLLLATFIVNSFEAYLGDGEFSIDNPIVDVATDGDDNEQSAKTMLATFVSAVSFQMNGLPVIFALVLFTVPTFILMFLSIELLIKFLDAVIPF